MIKPTLCRALDSDRFLSAWLMAQEAAETPLPLGSPPHGPVSSREAMGWLVVCRAEFPDSQDAMSCSLRFFGITCLIERGVLGPFYDAQHGIWSDAVKQLARARCHVTNGFDVADVTTRLARLEPPTV